MRLVFGILVIWTSAMALHAQQVKIFEDDFGVQGEVRTAEVFEVGKLPEKGPIDIKWRNFDGNKLVTYRVKGASKNAQLDGVWTWEVARWKYVVNAGESVKPNFSALGKRKKWNGSFKDGKPNGKWIFTLDSLASDGRTIDQFIRLEITFKNGTPTGTFLLNNNLENKALKLIGSCDNDGVAHGNWTFTYKNEAGKFVKETRIYTKGLLTEIKRNDGAKTETIVLDHTVQFLNQKSDTSIVKLGAQLFEKDEMPSSETQALHNALKNYFLSSWNLPVIGAIETFQIPKFRQLTFLLTQKEKQQIDEIQTQVDFVNDKIEQYSQANTFIQRHRNARIDTTISYLELVKNRYTMIDSLLKTTTTESFAYLNKDQALTSKWKTLFSQNKNKKGEVFTTIETVLPAIIFEEKESFFDGILHYVKKENSKLESYFAEITNETIAIQQEGELDQIAHQIEERFKLIEQLYKGKFGVALDIQEQLIDGESHRLIQEFSLATEFKEAKEIGLEALILLDSLETWSKLLTTFDEMEQSLKTKYRYLAYNPYTGENDIEVKIKKRFLNTILTQLWPYLNMELKAAKSFKEWSSAWGNYFDIYNYLMQFAGREDAQAQRIEKRVRKEKKSERILKILLLQIEAEEINKNFGKN